MRHEDQLDLEHRTKILDTLSTSMPLSYTAGVTALRVWGEQIHSGGITVLSKTAREVTFYLGPARRVFPDHNETLRRGRGRLAIIAGRSVIQPNWLFAPFDLGEMTFHWLPNRVVQGYYRDIPDQKRRWLRQVDGLEQAFRQFLHEAFENPWDYLNGWIPPRKSLESDRERNQVYQAASVRLFGRPRCFAPAWTFELRARPPVRIANEDILALVFIQDEVTHHNQEFVDILKKELPGRWHEYSIPPSLIHPDLPTIILEAATTDIIRRHLERLLGR